MSSKDRFYLMRNQPSFDGLRDLVSHINSSGDTKDMHMIEIGSYVGDSTLLFSEHFKSVIAIDPFLDDYDPSDDACNYAPFDRVYDEFMLKTKDNPKIHLIRKTSDEAVEAIKEAARSVAVMDLEEHYIKAFDLVYIDGMHTYDQVKQDIQNYLPFIKKGGFIAGHDYHPNWQGVIDAVNQTVGIPDAIFQDTSWIKKL